MIVENLFNSINKGRAGLNSGLSTGLPKLDGLVYGVQRRWMNVTAGDSGKSYIASFICKSKGKLLDILES